MKSPIDILSTYWGYDQFRPMQEDIIRSVLSGKDTLALLPTGGGKSICFQVPALMQEGICIVVSPLIALMKDQVLALKNKSIKALSVTSENSPREIDNILDRCIYEDIKFLYLSPERLLTELAQVRIAKMKVNLIAVDEAHCISEWGYDFRPPYLKIAEIRPLHPKVPVIALTASATPMVVKDIQEKLEFKKPQVFTRSFARPNLAYFVEYDEDKLGKIERIATKLRGTGIIYTRSRKGTERITRELCKRGLSVDFYHAGLDSEMRSQRQEAWMKGSTKIIAATNAFGMGIDKPNVRFVIHTDLPDTLENYYQECGRAGRDEKKAFAVSLITAKDLEKLKEKVENAFPEKDEIRSVYHALGSMLKLAYGSGKDETFPIDIELLCNTYKMEERIVVHSLKFLEREGYIVFDESEERHSVLCITSTHEAIHKLRMDQPNFEPLINAILRSYTRLFDEDVLISEWTLAKRLKWTKEHVEKGLGHLHSMGAVRYRKASNLPRITYLTERLQHKNVRISNEHYALRKHVVIEKVESMIHFAETLNKCRTRMLTEYFGETNADNCGVCDYCVRSKS